MIPGRLDDTGALFITTVNPPGSGATFQGGFSRSRVGVIHATISLGTRFNGGHMTTDDGKLCIAPGGVKAGSVNGLPVTALGQLVTQLNQPVSPGDAFVGGIRVGPAGGVYTIDVTPIEDFSFSNGFSTGFDVEAVQ